MKKASSYLNQPSFVSPEVSGKMQSSLMAFVFPWERKELSHSIQRVFCFNPCGQ